MGDTSGETLGRILSFIEKALGHDAGGYAEVEELGGGEGIVGCRTLKLGKDQAVSETKQYSVIGRDATGFYFLGYGPDHLTLRNDLNKALSVVQVPKLTEILRSVTFIHANFLV